MKGSKNKTLIDALSYCDLRELPKKDSGEYIWLKSLALANKADGSSCYLLATRDEKGNPRIIKDFGSVSAIKEIVEYYPIVLLDSCFMPTCKTKTKEERIEWLKRIGVTEDLSELGIKELNKLVLNNCMQTALQALNSK